MPKMWTSEVVSKMHMYKIKQTDIAKALGWTAEYVSMVLNGHRCPKGAEEKFRKAIEKLTEEKR